MQETSNEEQTAELWSKEYMRRGLPSSFRADPSGSVVLFSKHLGQDLSGMHGLDVGAGTGRNSIYLAKLGAHVTALEIVPELVDGINQAGKELNLQLQAQRANVGSRWPVGNDNYDFVVDTFCYKHLSCESEREKYRLELERVIKEDGHFLLTLASTNDSYYGSLAPAQDGSLRVVIDPANQIPSVLYDKDSITSTFSPGFILELYTNKRKPSLMHGACLPRSTHVFVFKRSRDERL